MAALATPTMTAAIQRYMTDGATEYSTMDTRPSVAPMRITDTDPSPVGHGTPGEAGERGGHRAQDADEADLGHRQ